MAVNIIETFSNAPYGRVDRISPLVRRVLARNPSRFTFTGTGTYIVGRGEVAIIDAGPDDPEHIAALLAAVEGEIVSTLLVTHNHIDHSPATMAVAEATGARILGCTPLDLSDDGPRADASFDSAYAPHDLMNDGDAVDGPGWTLSAVATPGHTSNHLCFALAEEQALFSGDHVMGWSTTVVAPPDGDMAAYLASLRKVGERDDLVYYPTHGPAIKEPQRLVKGLIAHRRQREAQILRLLEQGAHPIPEMVESMYASVDKVMWPAAGRSVLAHLLDLEARGKVRRLDDQWEQVA